MRALLVVLIALAVPAAAQAVTLPDVEDEVMCVQCGTALNISQAPSADQERALIREDIAKGMSKEEIKRHLVSEYGPKVLAEPHQRTSWLVPLILAALALATVATTVRRWRRSTPDDATEPELDPTANARLERDMAGYDL
jgi:cytochrome c-type biogenesis protein CcmH